jgi:WD40 repeat protein
MQLEVDGAILSAGFSSNLMEGLATTSAATMWHVDFNTASRVPLLAAHAADILSLTPSQHNSDLLATTCKDGLLRVWQLGNRDVRVSLGALLRSTMANKSCFHPNSNKHMNNTRAMSKLIRPAVLVSTAHHSGCSVPAFHPLHFC